MKLLGWMNRKTRQNNIEPLHNFSIGNSCSCFSLQPSFEEQQYHSESSYKSAHSRQTKGACPQYSNSITANKEEDILAKESSVMMSELFNGFLTIGTFGLEPCNTEPTTPRFAISFQNANEKETEATETELKLINDELEKFLEAEATDVNYDSSERSSYVSTITLSNFQLDGVDVEEKKHMGTCPLQGYLFGSSIDCPETDEEIKKEKGTLRELFKNNSRDVEQYKAQYEEEKTPYKGTHPMHFMKTMLKKINIPSRSWIATFNDHAADSVPTKRKLPKALGMLRRRINHERPPSDKKLTKLHGKLHRYENENTSHGGKNQDGDVKFLDKENQRFFHTSMLKEEITTMSLSHDGLSKSPSTGTGELWIKTDADYLVLEL